MVTRVFFVWMPRELGRPARYLWYAVASLQWKVELVVEVLLCTGSYAGACMCASTHVLCTIYQEKG